MVVTELLQWCIRRRLDTAISGSIAGRRIHVRGGRYSSSSDNFVSDFQNRSWSNRRCYYPLESTQQPLSLNDRNTRDGDRCQRPDHARTHSACSTVCGRTSRSILGITDLNQINAIEAASLLHDMGKLAVPEYILNKPGKLTPAEFERMKLHASIGADILSAIDFPYPVVPIVRHHHENWDGTGYPDGIRGTAIPIGARILSVVDCFDALTSDRPYSTDA